MRTMWRAPRLALVIVMGLAGMCLTPSALAHHTPYAHLTAELSLPHQLTASLLSAPVATALPDAPDLYPFLPTNEIGGTPPYFVDTYEQLGKVLYRFDTVIANAAGTLQLYCQNCTSSGSQQLWQMVWPGGRPPPDDLPDPYSVPTNTQSAQDLVPAGAYMVYSSASGHNHWHYDLAAWYDILVPGGSDRRDNKVGFCMFDTWSGEDYFGGGGWCRSSAPSAGFVHMGISPDKGDFYNAQLADQWIDVTGLPPGDYTLRATVNPPGTIIEASTANNVLDVTRTIPGAIANDTSGTAVSGFGSTITLGGSVIGDDISSVANGSCNLYNSNCYTTASPSTLTYTVVDSPDHGTVTINGTGLSAAATYTSQAGYTGQDSFTYTTTDSRGLESSPATVTVQSGPAASAAASSSTTTTAATTPACGTSGSFSAAASGTARAAASRSPAAGSA